MLLERAGMRIGRWGLVALVSLLGLSCATVSPSGSRGALEPVPGIKAAGPRCQGGACVCRPLPPAGDAIADGAELPAGQKRFELRLAGGLDPTTVTVEKRGTLVRSVRSVGASCAYIDLPPGKYRVRLAVDAVNRQQGIRPSLSVSEYGAATQSWYDTFDFECGAPLASCSRQDVHDWFERVAAHPRGIFDPCGSTRVLDVHWGVQHSPEMTLEDLELDFVLQVYAFTPRFVHGTATCKGLTGGKAAEDEAAGLPE